MEDEIVEVEGLVELEDETQVESLEEDLGTELMADDKGKEAEGDHQHICCPDSRYPLCIWIHHSLSWIWSVSPRLRRWRWT